MSSEKTSIRRTAIESLHNTPEGSFAVKIVLNQNLRRKPDVALALLQSERCAGCVFSSICSLQVNSEDHANMAYTQLYLFAHVEGYTMEQINEEASCNKISG